MNNDIVLIETKIKTSKSFFKIYDFTNTELLDNCISEIKGKLNINRNREVGFFSDLFDGMYKYGDVDIAQSQRLTPSLSIILDKINKEFNSDYNGILINRYDNGNKFIERHSDSKNHPENGVLLISYGAVRTFRVFDSIRKRNPTINIPLLHGKMIHMGGDFQTEFEHDLKREPEINEERYSISFHKYMNLGKY